MYNDMTTRGSSNTDGVTSILVKWMKNQKTQHWKKYVELEIPNVKNDRRLSGDFILRDLDSLNSAANSTRFIFTVALIFPLFMGCGAWALADGAAPTKAFHENYLSIFGLGISLSAIVAFPIPYIFRWNWETKYFGAGALSFSSCSIIGLYPTLCVAQYSSLPFFARIIFLGLQGGLILHWCRRFVEIYKVIYCDKRLFNCIYTEESSEIFYSQRADNKVIERLLKLEQFPPSKYFVLFSLAAFSMVPFAASLSRFIGLPFIHIFLSIFAIPLNLMFLGLTTRLWLIFYFYPMKLKRETNKPVYVDMSSPPPKCLKLHKTRKYKA